MAGRTREVGRLALLLSVAVIAAGCGAGGPSVEEFRAEASDICEESRGNIEAAASEVLGGGELPNPQELGKLAQGTIVPETEKMLDRLAEVEPAEEVADEYQAFLDEAEQTVDKIRKDPTMLMDPTNFAEVNKRADAANLSAACRIGPG